MLLTRNLNTFSQVARFSAHKLDRVPLAVFCASLEENRSTTVLRSGGAGALTNAYFRFSKTTFMFFIELEFSVFLHQITQGLCYGGVIFNEFSKIPSET